ncbi:MAG: P-loop NTPase fold protein [Streptosporangiaceae bacterium]
MRGDQPVSSRDEDRLGRALFADRMAAMLHSVPAEHGLVVALTGPWGSGKTSVLNMVRKDLVGRGWARTVLEFNPWMFSGSEQLVRAFFEQVSAQLRLSKGTAELDLASQLADYGQALTPLVFVPVAGPWLARAGVVSGAVGKVLKARKKIDPVEVQRRRIESALAKLPEPIFIMVDDVDRLTAREIRDIFALVRLTAHFPKIIYVLAFDRSMVERALDDGEHGDGRRYLDKIVEVGFDLPTISQPALEALLLGGIEEATGEVKTGPFDQRRWPDVFYRVIRPLFSTPREVNRYLAPLPAMLGALGEEVALVDVLALEAVRIRLPDLFTQLESLSGALTAVGMNTSQSPNREAEVQTFTASAGPHEETAAEMCRLLFPATERYLGGSTTYGSEWLARWRAERRVASPDVLGIYLSGLLPPGTVPAPLIDQAVASLADRGAFQALVESLPDRDLEDLLARLEAHQGSFTPAAAQPASAVLLGIYPRLRTRSTGFLDPGPELAVDRVVLRLLQAVPATEQRTAIVEALCSEVASYTGRIRLLELAGRRPNPQFERLIPAPVSNRLYKQVCQELRHISAEALTLERDPLGLLASALAEDPADRADVESLLHDPDAAAALLRSAVAEVRSQPLGSAAVTIQPVLRWELLRTVAGEDQAIMELADTAATNPESSQDLAVAIEMAHQYLAGQRPPPPPFAGRPLVLRPPLNSPGTHFSPNLSTGWPGLLLRALTSYEVDPLWAANADISGREFHDRLAGFLVSAPLTEQIAAMAEKRGLLAEPGQWRPDPDVTQYSKGAVEQLVLGPTDCPAVMVKVAVFLPGNPGTMRLITDVYLSPTQATDANWAPLSLTETRDVLVTALDVAGGAIAEAILRAVFSGELPTRTAIELYLYPGQAQIEKRASTTLEYMIDLKPLGALTRPGQPASQGLFAVAGDTPISSAQDRHYLCGQALTRMALDWGYLDAPAALESLAHGPQ